MRLCVVADPDTVHTGRLLRLLVARGHEVHFVGKAASGVPGAVDHFLPLYAGGRRVLRQLRTLALGLRFRALVRRLRPDAVHLFGLFPFLSCGCLTLAGLPRLVVTALGSDIVDHGEAEPALHAARRWILGRATTVVALSAFLAGRMEAYLADGRRARVVPLAAASELRPRPPHEGFVVGFAKRLLRVYGADLLLRAAARVPDVRVRIAGEGPERPALEALARELGIAGRVEFAGWIAPGRIADFHAGLDLFAMPTRIPESFGLAAAEAAMQEVPTVAARIGGIPEAVGEEADGTLVPPDDVEALARALAEYAADPARTRARGVRARARAVARFAEERVAEMLEELYRPPAPRPVSVRIAYLFVGETNGGRLPPQVEDRLGLLGERRPVRALVPERARAIPAGVEAVRVPEFPLRGLRGASYALAAAWLAPRALAGASAALTRLSPWLFGAYLAARLRGVPILAEFHALPNEGLEARGWNGPAVRLLFRLGARLASGFLLVGKRTEDLVRTLGDVRRPVAYLGNGARASTTFPAPAAESRRRLGIEGAGPWIGHLGTLGPWTDGPALRAAARAVAARRVDARWLFVGFGMTAAPEGAVVRSAVPQEEVRFAASALDVGVISLSADWDRRYGVEPLKLFTYMGCGVPVVAPDLPGLGDIVRAERCGLLYPPGDGAAMGERIVELLDSADLARSCGRAGREAFLARYSWESKMPALLRALDDIVITPATKN